MCSVEEKYAPYSQVPIHAQDWLSIALLIVYSIGYHCMNSAFRCRIVSYCVHESLVSALVLSTPRTFNLLQDYYSKTFPLITCRHIWLWKTKIGFCMRRLLRNIRITHGANCMDVQGFEDSFFKEKIAGDERNSRLRFADSSTYLSASEKQSFIICNNLNKSLRNLRNLVF